MNAKKESTARNVARFCPIKTIGFTGGLNNAQSMRKPLVAVMSSLEAETFRVQGLRIAAKIPVQSPSVAMKQLAVHLKHVREVQVAVEGTHAICALDFLPQFTRALNFFRKPRHHLPYQVSHIAAYAMGHVTGRTYTFHEAAHRLVVNHTGKRRPKGHKKFCRWVAKDPEIKVEPDQNGQLNIVILYYTPVPPPVRFKFKQLNNEDPDQPEQSDNIFLKKPHQDMQIIRAVVEASHQEFGDSHKGQLRYGTEAHNYKTKNYTDTHLLVCLFFYIHVNRLNISTDFYIGQRAQLLGFCKKQLENRKFQLCSESYFTRCITSLDTQKESFESYLVQHNRPPAQREKGMPDMLFWYEIYRRTELLFINAIPRVRDNK